MVDPTSLAWASHKRLLAWEAHLQRRETLRVLTLCSCSSLTNDLEPFGPKSVFSGLDEHVVVWARIADIKKETRVQMDWYNPNQDHVFSVFMDVRACTDERPTRVVWSHMRVPLVHHIQHGLGIWEVRLNAVDKVCRFRVIDVSSDYSRNHSKSVTSTFLDRRY